MYHNHFGHQWKASIQLPVSEEHESIFLHRLLDIAAFVDARQTFAIDRQCISLTHLFGEGHKISDGEV